MTEREDEIDANEGRNPLEQNRPHRELSEEPSGEAEREGEDSPQFTSEPAEGDEAYGDAVLGTTFEAHSGGE